MSGDTVPNLQENTPNFTPNDSPCRKFDEMIVMWIALPLSTILGRVRWGFRKDLGLFTDGPAILAIGYGDYRFIRSEEHTSEIQSLMRITFAVFCLNNKHN